MSLKRNTIKIILIRKTLTDKFRQVYASNFEGKELIEYPLYKSLLNSLILKYH